MKNISKCQRCGKPLTTEEPKQLVLMAKYRNWHDRVIRHDFELCEDCANDMVAWIYEKQKRDYKTGG